MPAQHSRGEIGFTEYKRQNSLVSAHCGSHRNAPDVAPDSISALKCEFVTTESSMLISLHNAFKIVGRKTILIYFCIC